MLHSDTIWQIVFFTACIYEYTHNYLHCIIDLTKRGWHTLRLSASNFIIIVKATIIEVNSLPLEGYVNKVTTHFIPPAFIT